MNGWIHILEQRVEAMGDRLLYRFLADGEAETQTVRYGEMQRRARAVAARLMQEASAGDRALVIVPPGVGFIEAFLGCLHAGVVAVPTYPPRSAQHARVTARLHGVAGSCRPSVVVGEAAQRGIVDAILGDAVRFVAVDEIPSEAAEGWRRPAVTDQTLACLQYTSGTTGDAKGVMLTHGNLASNVKAIQQAFGQTRQSHGVVWLPPYHDMGLIGGVLQPLYGGFQMTLMPPAAFLQRPSRWMQAISRFKGTTSGGPNFAYELCARSITDEEVSTLDLSSWTVAFSGAEQVRVGTMERFVERLGRAGFRRDALVACYGLAESSLMVTCAARGELRTTELEGRRIVSCGKPAPGSAVVVVDPQTRRAVEDGSPGEIWVAGPSVAVGYWEQPALTEQIFNQRLAGDERRYLRTGDLGVCVEGEIHVVSRLKDLVVVRGINYAPVDLEQTVEAAHQAVQPDGCAAFGVEGESGTDELVLAVELRREQRTVPPEGVFDAIRAAMSVAHELDVGSIVLLRPGSLARTPSGKLQRGTCRRMYVDNALAPIATWRHLAPAGPSDTPTWQNLREWMIRQVALAAHLEVARVDVSAPLARYGLGSADAVALAGRISEGLGLDLPPTLVWDHPTIDDLCTYLHASPDEEDAQVAALIHEGVL